MVTFATLPNCTINLSVTINALFPFPLILAPNSLIAPTPDKIFDGTKNTPFPVVIGYEEWLTVCHISRGVSFLMHIAFHDGKRVALDRISRIVYKYRSLIVNDETRIAVG